MPPTATIPGLVLAEHEIEVPLDHATPDGERITVFAREVVDPDGRDRPWLLFLQGGPGHEATRPTGAPTITGWIGRALRDFRVLLLDQRGTGRSSPVGALQSMTPAEQAAHLEHFRADAIVRDAEVLREGLGIDRWSVLGQSFGGFCATTYLSLAPDALREVLITGGLPPLDRHPDEVYAATWARIVARGRRLYERYPADRERVRALLRRIDAEDLRLPDGDRLTAVRLRMVGSALGMSYGAEQVHHVLELPPDSPGFRHDVQDPMGVARNPLYALLNEACYADGTATRWSAARTMPADFEAEPELLTGEHFLPAILDEFSALAPLREAAHLLAEQTWPRLHDPEVLSRNTVPVAAAIYAEDPYVERAFSEETAAAIPRLRPWVTNEYDHDALRSDGARVLGRLLDLTRGRA